MNIFCNIIIFGHTNAGKDTAQQYISNEHGWEMQHPHWGARNMMEEYYDLPKGYLRSGDGKYQMAPGATASYQEIMRQEWRVRRDTDPLYSSRYIQKWPTDRSYVIQGVRNPEELETIVKKMPHHNYMHLWISSPFAQKLDTDQFAWGMYNKSMVPTYRSIVENHRVPKFFDDLKKAVDSFQKSLLY